MTDLSFFCCSVAHVGRKMFTAASAAVEATSILSFPLMQLARRSSEVGKYKYFVSCTRFFTLVFLNTFYVYSLHLYTFFLLLRLEKHACYLCVMDSVKYSSLITIIIIIILILISCLKWSDLNYAVVLLNVKLHHIFESL